MNEHLDSREPKIGIHDGFESRIPRPRNSEAEGHTLERLASIFAQSPSEALGGVLDASLKLCGAHSAAIALNESTNNSRAPLWQAFAGELAHTASRALIGSESGASASILTGTQVRHFVGSAAELSEPARLGGKIVEALAAPVRSEGVAVGALWVFSHDERRTFDAEDARVLEQLAIRAAIAQRLRAHTRVSEDSRYRHERRLELLWHSAEVLLTAHNPVAMLHALFEQIRDDLRIDTYFNFMAGDDGQSLTLASCLGIAEEEAEKIRHLGYGQAICGMVALQRVSIVATHIQESSDPHVQLVKSYGIRAYACNPLISGNRLLGTLSFATRSHDHFAAADLDFFRMISRYVAVAYERLSLIEGLREADRRKDEFLAMLAHELRNPLAPMRTTVELLKRKVIDPDLRGAHGIIERQVNNMVRLVDDLLDVARVTQGRVELQCARVTLSMVLDQAIEATRPALERADHELSMNLPDQPITLDADSTRLAQVFANLLDNAAKYTPRGGRIAIDARVENDDLYVAIEDNGTGIPRAILPRIFDLFTQADHTLQRSRGGLGIGLTLVRKLVELHGGSVTASSAGENRGSRFQVRLPLSKSESSGVITPAPTIRSESHSKRAKRILVVDDNRDAADSLAVLLRGDGHNVELTYEAARALPLIQQYKPDIVLLDLGMPGMDGHEVCRLIRREQGELKLKVIALTGYGQPGDRLRTHASGFNAHLVKPVDVAALTTLINSAQAE